MSEIIEVPKTRTEAQRAAARANGAKSKGPITPEGKSKSALNAIRHGMLAGSLVLTTESREKFDAVLQGYLDDYQPEGQTENDLVEAIVAAKWLQQRCWCIANSLTNVTMDRMAQAIADEFSEIDTGTRTALAFLKQADQSAALALLDRYAARHDREWNRAVDKLRKIQKERRQGTAAPTGHRPLATDHCISPNEPEPALTPERTMPEPELVTSHQPLATETSPNEPEPTVTPVPSTTSDSQLATDHRPLATAKPLATKPASDSPLAPRHSPLDVCYPKDSST